MSYPKIIQNLINQFSKLPSIGPKTAERLVFHLLYRPQQDLHDFGEAIEHLKDNVCLCQSCFNFAENDPCHICGDKQRNQKIICVVTKPQDLTALEKIGSFNGVYHILGGNINALSNQKPIDLKIAELEERVKSQNVEEVILAFNPDMPGETTTIYLTKLLKKNPTIKISRLARGLPMGADLEYADEITLESALNSRQKL